MEKKPMTTTIMPSDIILPKGGFCATKWGRLESEWSAWYLLKMAKKNGSWRDFTQAQINRVARHDFWFNYLIPCGDIIENKKYDVNTGKEIKVVSYSFTDSFVEELVKNINEREYRS